MELRTTALPRPPRGPRQPFHPKTGRSSARIAGFPSPFLTAGERPACPYSSMAPPHAGQAHPASSRRALSAAHRLGPRGQPELGARRASEPASKAARRGSRPRRPAPPRVPPAHPRRGLRGTRSGSDPRRSPTPRQVSGAEAGGDGGHGAGATLFLGLFQPVGSRGCGVERGGDQGWVRHILQAALPSAPLPLPRRPKQLFTTKSERSSRRRGAESFLSLKDPFWRILLCSAWARVQLRQMRVPVPGSSSPSVSWLGTVGFYE